VFLCFATGLLYGGIALVALPGTLPVAALADFISAKLKIR